VPALGDEVARYGSVYATSRDLAIVGLMTPRLRSAEVLALNRDDALLSEASFVFLAKEPQIALPAVVARNRATAQSLSRWNDPIHVTPALIRLTHKGRARGTRMTRCGIAFLIPIPRQANRIQLANLIDFDTLFARTMIRAV